MKIALLTPTFCHFSGIDRVVELEAQELINEGHQVVILTFYATLKPQNLKIIELGLPKNPTLERIYRLLFFLDYSKIKKAASLIKDCDIVMSQLYPMNLIASYAKKKYGIKYVSRYHGFTPYNMFSRLEEKVYMIILNYLIFKSMNSADEIYSDSKFVADELFARARMKSRVKYIPINRKIYNLKSPVLKSVKDEIKLLKGPVLLYIGRLSPHKGIDLLIKSFNLILQKRPDAKLVIIGKPTFKGYFDNLKKMSNSNIIFKGFVADELLPSYYKSCSVYVTCSLWEGYDMPAVEAQACGKPVVAFDIGAHKEVIKKGKLAKSGDITAFAKHVLEYLNMYRK